MGSATATTTSTSTATPGVRPTADDDTEVRRQPPYHVILWNDEQHTYAYVEEMLARLFRLPVKQGHVIARTVDTRGKAVVLTTSLEHAELKRDQIHAFGRDRLVASCRGAMSATIEPAS